MEKRILKKLQMTELDILDEIVRVCDKNNIKYFLMGGTLLGAIRHKGFIPWDDDIDICMLREDYERFIKIAPNELKEKYKMVNCKTDKNTYLPYTKIVNKNTKFVEKSAQKFKMHNGIWVDIFPFDYIDKIDENIKRKNKFIKFIMGVLVNKKLKLKMYSNKILSKIIVKLFEILPSKLLFKIIDIIIGKSKSNKKYTIGYFSYYNIENNVYKTSDIFPLKKTVFEGKKYDSPNNYDAILKTTYGDYMKLPPKDKQVTHNPIQIVFEDGEVVNFSSSEDKN